MSKKASLCVECKHETTYGEWMRYDGLVCKLGHKPRFYMPKNGNPHDPRAGWRRVCEDYQRKEATK